MPSPEQVAEGRRTLADKITDAQGYAHRGGFTRTTVFLTDIDVEVLLAALRAEPARAAEEMRNKAVILCMQKATSLHRSADAYREMVDSDSGMRLAADLAREQSRIARNLGKAIRALPIQGGGDA